jgi:DTW domain-containing protein YfiP
MRDFCFRCRKAKITCYCSRIREFETDPRFVILVHPRELRNSVGTGRMLHLSVTNSLLIDGHDFTQDPRVHALIADPRLHCVVLYPGRDSLNLSECTREEAFSFTPPGKKLVIFVIDGTWDLARGMINRSANLRALPQLRFTPETRSAYEIRQQPRDYCLSTLESVHWMIERFDRLGLYPAPADDAHHGLIRTFRFMVEQQIEYAGQNLRRTEGMRERAVVPGLQLT